MTVQEYRNNRLMGIQVLKLAAYQNAQMHTSFNNNDLIIIIRYKHKHVLPFKEAPAYFIHNTNIYIYVMLIFHSGMTTLN